MIRISIISFFAYGIFIIMPYGHVRADPLRGATLADNTEDSPHRETFGCLPIIGGCAAGLSCCGFKCVDLQSDPEHCGACSTECSDSTPFCVFGECAAGAITITTIATSTTTVTSTTTATQVICPSGTVCDTQCCPAPQACVTASLRCTCVLDGDCNPGHLCVNGECCPTAHACANVCCATACNNGACPSTPLTAF